MDIPERNIIDQFRTGNIDAFGFIFKAYYNNLVNYAYQIVKDIQAAEDLVEQTMLYTWENRRSINIEKSLKSYLFRSVYNNCINHIKHLKVTQRHILYFKHHIHTDNTGNPDINNFPLSQMIDKEIGISLAEAIERLPRQCREIFILSRYENLSSTEIATKLNISVNTVKTQILRAVHKLCDDLKEFLPMLILFLI